MLRALLVLVTLLLAFPACAENRFGGGLHGAGFHRGGFHAFHRSGGHGRGFFGGYVCGYDCGVGIDSGSYDYGYGGYENGFGGGYGNGNRYGYGGHAGNTVSNNLPGSYVPDPVGANIPPMVFPTNCWVRRAAYDPSGAYFGPVLVDLCRPSDSVTVTGLKARAKPNDAGPGAAPPPGYRSGSPQPPQ